MASGLWRFMIFVEPALVSGVRPEGSWNTSNFFSTMYLSRPPSATWRASSDFGTL